MAAVALGLGEGAKLKKFFGGSLVGAAAVVGVAPDDDVVAAVAGGAPKEKDEAGLSPVACVVFSAFCSAGLGNVVDGAAGAAVEGVGVGAGAASGARGGYRGTEVLALGSGQEVMLSSEGVWRDEGEKKAEAPRGEAVSLAAR